MSTMARWSWEKPELTPEERKAERARALAKKAARLVKAKTPHAVSRLGDLMDDLDPKVALAACALILKHGGVGDAVLEAEVEARLEERIAKMIADAEQRARDAVAGSVAAQADAEVRGQARLGAIDAAVYPGGDGEGSGEPP